MKIFIRKATGKDYDAFCELIDEVDAFHRRILPHLFQKPDGPVRDYDYFLGLITDENISILVAESDNKLLGFVHVLIKDTPAIPIFVPRRFAIVDGLGVKLEFQNQGIGRMLMDSAHEWAIKKGATTIELNVYEINHNAITFYQNLGYETASRKMSRPLNQG